MPESKTIDDDIIIYRPEPPRKKDGRRAGLPASRKYGMYVLVVQDDRIYVGYHQSYFRTVDEVVEDLCRLLDEEAVKGEYGQDFVVWWHGRVLAVVHVQLQSGKRKITRFRDKGNEPDFPARADHWPTWPTYEEWVANGKGDLWFRSEKSDAQAQLNLT